MASAQPQSHKAAVEFIPSGMKQNEKIQAPGKATCHQPRTGQSMPVVRYWQAGRKVAELPSTGGSGGGGAGGFGMTQQIFNQAGQKRNTGGLGGHASLLPVHLWL